MSHTDRPTLGICLRILSGALVAGMFVCVKAVEQAVPLGEIVFFRSFFALIPLVIFLWLRGEWPHGLRTRRLVGHGLRSGLGAIGLFTSFASVVRLNISEATLIAQLTPLLMTALAVLWLREKPTIWRIGGLILGFVGVIVLVSPELDPQLQDRARLVGYGLGFISAICAAGAFVMVRRLNTTESPGAIAFYFVLVSMGGALLTIPFGSGLSEVSDRWIMPEGLILVFLILAGLFGGFAHIAMTLAFRYAEVSRLAPFEYVALLWPILADVFIFQSSFSNAFILSSPLILMGIVCAATERKRV